MKLSEIETPALVLDKGRLARNLARMTDRARALGVKLRPHVKTTKSATIAEMATGGHGPITVSTLKEAEYYIAHGFRDILYAVGITPQKLGHVAAFIRDGIQIKVVLDSLAIAHEVVRAGTDQGVRFQVMIEIDCGAARAGLDAGDPAVVEIARLLDGADHVELVGVMAHAGHSYEAKNIEEIKQIAEDERLAVVAAATAIEAAGISCPVRSVGSTPTALFADHLEGVTEMRPGVYMLGDIYQVHLGTCQAEDVAVSVLATVIGHKPGQDFALIDAGGLALSKDRSAADHFDRNIGYGWVHDLLGQQRYADITLGITHQEHGWLQAVEGAFPYSRHAVGSKVRVMPNHACMMTAPYDRYYVVDGTDEIIETWDKTTGW